MGCILVAKGGIMGNPFSTDLSYVVSVKALREILDGISTEDERWWIDEEKSESVVIGYNDCSQCGLHSSGIHDILFKFPKIASLPFLDGDGEMVCLYPNSRKAVQRGLYWENGNLLND